MNRTEELQKIKMCTFLLFVPRLQFVLSSRKFGNSQLANHLMIKLHNVKVIIHEHGMNQKAARGHFINTN